VATPTEPSDVRNTSATVETVAPAFWVAGAAFVVASGLEVAFIWNLQTSACGKLQNWVATGTGAAGGGSPLFLGSPAVLLIGGIISLSLVVIRRSRGRPRRGWAMSAAVLEMALSLVLVAVNFLASIARTFECEPLTFPGG
jgi:hypothetical protein